jgi:hypothetical protein
LKTDLGGIDSMHGILLLIAIVIYFVLAKSITRKLAGIPEKNRNKRIVSLLCIITAIAIPFWDMPMRYWEFNRLCKTEAGIHVYEEVVLGPEYWNEDNTLKTRPPGELKDQTIEEFKVIPGEFEVVNKDTHPSSITNIRKFSWQIKRKKDQKIMGERIRFYRGPGWLHRNTIGPHGNSKFCPDEKEVPFERLIEAVFKQPSK